AEAQNKLGFCYYNGKGTQKDYSRALTNWRNASEQGLAKAQSNLAICYSKGHGTVMDKAKAFEWWEKAAALGNANAQCSLGICYYNGVGTKKDDEKAFGWWIRAAEQGHAKSQANVALCYHSGIGVERDDERAFEWWQRSAEGGYLESFFNLGVCYQNGEGTNADPEKAKEMYEKVLLSGDPELRERAASAIDRINEALSESGKASGGDGIFEFELLTDGSYCVRIKEEYKAKEKVENRKDGTLSFTMSYDCSCPEEVVIPDSHNGKSVSVIGDGAFTNCKTMKRVSIPVGITSIGQAAFSFCDALGEIVLPDGLRSIGAEAFIGCDGLEKIYIPGSVYAIGENAFLLCDSLAEITFDGDIDEWEILGLEEHELPDGVSLNFTQMTPSDMYDLGYDYENGRNERKKDPALAFEWYKKSSDAGYAPATYALGWCFKKGIGTEKDLKKAFSFYKLSAEMGYSYAENALGVCYHNGEGIEKDLKEAVKRYKKAADGGIASAQCNLADCYEKGSGTEKDLKKARELYLLARSSKQESVSARAEEGIRRVEAAIKSSEALEAQKQRAAEEKKRENDILAKHLLYQRTGDNGNADDQYERGSFYMHCDNEHIRNHAEGYLWLEKAAKAGHAGAQYECGCYYESDLFSQRDLYAAEKWYSLAASQGHSAAKVSLLRVQAAIKKEEDEKARRMTEFRLDGVCQHCGGRFVGLFSKKCSVCGKPKDYR
ncbi:MAG: SEL1-like repeat protein, partial [Clostridia bacterium]|nr:SEL1-like repeat protein [Clostridia bacterium]